MTVDMTIGNEMLSLMDGFSGYNQIMIAKEDQHKMAFTCPWQKYCWNMMSFGLKNVGATYQREMTLIFHDMIHKTVEDYVDDILEKSRKRWDQLVALMPSLIDWRNTRFALFQRSVSSVYNQGNCWDKLCL